MIHLTRKKNFLFVCFILLISHSAVIALQDSLNQDENSKHKLFDKLKFSSYGVINYYAYDWETLPNQRNAIDLERWNLYLSYDFTPKIQLFSEIEFEHGGTGSSMSFDPLEEFGEFEEEIEKGGKVSLEQLNLFFRLNEKFNIRVGRLKVYMGNASKQDEPQDYMTGHRSEVENSLLPLGWYETGIEFSGDFLFSESTEYPKLSYKLYIMSGLDNTGFSSRNWIKKGYQTRFETVNADDLAYAMRLDYIFAKNSEIGISGYAGNATGNRPKNDFTDPSWVTYSDLHFTYNENPWRVSSYIMLGNIQNSEGLSIANRKLSNNLEVKRTPVGAMALGAYTELAYNIFTILDENTAEEFYLFARIDWYDSMFKTEGTISDNPRYERKTFNFGINYLPISEIVFKSHYSLRTLGSGEKENTFVLGLGFEF